MPEQITFYRDTAQRSPFCQRVEIALLEAGASFTLKTLDIYDKPTWFAQVNPMTGQIPVITYGGPAVPPDEPSPLSFKLTESYVILGFLADVFPRSNLLPPLSDPIGRARVRFFMDVATRSLEAATLEMPKRLPGAFEKLVGTLERIQAALPDPDAPDGGEYAIGKNFTIADCAIAPILAIIELSVRTNLGNAEPGTGKKLAETLAGGKFERLNRYRKVLWERVCVKKVIDLDRIEGIWKARYAGK